MSVPEFFEAQHPIVEALSGYSDRELVHGFQQHPDEGKYFVALFCRYGTLCYVLIRNMARSAMQTDYLFAKIWRNIFFELMGLDLGEPVEAGPEVSLQTWIFSKTALCINQEEAPAIESIQYALETASPPFWCYLQTALDQLPPLHRLVLVLSQTFHWSDTRILGLLEAEGTAVDRDALPNLRAQACQQLIEALPPDIRTIYIKQDSAPQAPDTNEPAIFPPSFL
jgi:hypothetical protein